MGIYGINLNLEIQTAQNLRLAQQTLNCSKSTIKILEKGIKSRLLNDVIDVMMSLLSLRLEREEALKYRYVCRPPCEKV